MARTIGLSNFTIAKLTKDDSTGVTYGTPTELERAIMAKIAPKSSTEKLYSDDNVEEIITNFDSIEVEIEVNQLTIESRALLQGSTVVKGVLIETKDDIPPTVAIGFKSKKSNGKYRYVWLLKGSFEITEDEYQTETDKPDAKTAKLKGTFYAREYDGNYRFMTDDDATGADATIIGGWFTAVPSEPTPA
jgi:phi13 family phage major tail protein